MVGGRRSPLLSDSPEVPSSRRSIHRNESSSPPCIQIVGAPDRLGNVADHCSENSAATMMCLGKTTLMQWANEGPGKFVLSRETTPPTLVMPSHMAMYSGRLLI